MHPIMYAQCMHAVEERKTDGKKLNYRTLNDAHLNFVSRDEKGAVPLSNRMQLAQFLVLYTYLELTAS